MALDQLHVSFNLKNIHCSDEGDGAGNAEPFLWVVYFKVDGDTVFVGNDLKLHGSATVVGTPGSHGNLPGDVDAGDTFNVPSVLGQWKTTLRPIPTPLAGKTVGGLVGCLAILLEEDSTSDHDINVGHAALNAAVQTGIDKLIKTLGISKQDVSDEEIAQLQATIQAKVEKAIADEVGAGEGLASYIFFGNGQDDSIGTGKWIGKHDQGRRLLNMETYVDNGVRRWSTVHRSGDWAHRLTVDRDKATFLKETQDLFDHKGLRLENLATYVDHGVRRWAGSYRSGDWGHRLTVDRDQATFLSETQDLFDHKGLRLEQAVTYVDGDHRRWAGIYRSGDWAHRFTIDRDTKTFIDETQHFFDHDGLRLIDVERYEVAGHARWAGVYRSGTWGHRMILDRGVESLLAETQEWFDEHGLRLVCTDVYEL
jgi:catechol 2,3-dioxygenase-like lactoylglutathione lyase family enzyme